MTPTMVWLTANYAKVCIRIDELNKRAEEGYRVFKPNYDFLVECKSMVTNQMIKGKVF